MSGPIRTTISRALAVLLLLAVVVSAWIVVIAPVAGLATDRLGEIETLVERRVNLTLIAERRATLETQAENLAKRIREEGGYWTGGSATAIAAAVQDRLRQAVTTHGGRVRTTSELRSTGEQTVQTVNVRFRIEGTIETIERTLVAIEGARPMLFVDAMTLVGHDGDGTTETPPVLMLDLDVSAYRATPGS